MAQRASRLVAKSRIPGPISLRAIAIARLTGRTRSCCRNHSAAVEREAVEREAVERLVADKLRRRILAVNESEA